MKKTSLLSVRLMLAVLLVPAFLQAAPPYGRFPKDPKVPVKAEYQHYFKDSYEASRADFLRMADSVSKVLPGCEPIRIQVPTQTGADLTVDGLYIPGKAGAGNLVVISSGIHGIEGYACSAVQRMMMDRFLTPENLASSGFLLIHSLNPYGFKFKRRVSENNVDMNRNSDATKDLFSIKNDGYTKLYKFINPDKPVSLGSCRNQFFVVTAIAKIIKSTMPVLRQAVLQGQYEYPEGLYFGGKDFEPQMAELRPIMVKYAGMYSRIVHVDLHTGYGERGKMHLFPNPPKSPEVKKATENLFPGYQIDWGDSKDFYVISGDFSALLGKLMPEKQVIPMLLEYGTMDSQKTMGSLRSIQNMILENQGFHHGYKNKRSERKVKGWFSEMYAPSSPVWRTMVMEQSEALMKVMFAELKR